MKRKLPLDYYRDDNVVSVARDLLGKHLFSFVDRQLVGGIIVETEAYRGPEDRGSHAWKGKRTPRNETMYHAGGVVYMYICYGIHDMVNIVTGSEGMSHAVLIRAVEPLVGLDEMRMRRSLFGQDKRLCQGPGALAKAFGLNKGHNGIDLQSDTVWIEDHHFRFSDEQIMESPRVGLNFEGPYKEMPWRFFVKGNPFVSRPRV